MKNFPGKLLFYMGLRKTLNATDIWYKQRLSSILIVPLSIIFFYPIFNLNNLNYLEAMNIYSEPFQLIFSILFFLVSFKHMEQGFEVIIEDYISKIAIRAFLLRLNTFFCWSMCLIGISSILWIFLRNF